MKLADVITGFVSFKQATGMRYRSEDDLLRSFSTAMGDVGIEEVSPASAAAFLLAPKVQSSYCFLSLCPQSGACRHLPSPSDHTEASRAAKAPHLHDR